MPLMLRWRTLHICFNRSHALVGVCDENVPRLLLFPSIPIKGYHFRCQLQKPMLGALTLAVAMQVPDGASYDPYYLVCRAFSSPRFKIDVTCCLLSYFISLFHPVIPFCYPMLKHCCFRDNTVASLASHMCMSPSSVLRQRVKNLIEARYL
jgi:hypothetical protein